MWGAQAPARRPAELRPVASGPLGLQGGRPFLCRGPSAPACGRPDRHLGTVTMWLDLEDCASARRASAPLPGQSQPQAFSLLTASASGSSLPAAGRACRGF